MIVQKWLTKCKNAGIVTIRDVIDEAGFIDYIEIRQKWSLEQPVLHTSLISRELKNVWTWQNMLRDVDLEYYDNNKCNVKDPPLLKVRGKKIIKFGNWKQKPFMRFLQKITL